MTPAIAKLQQLCRTWGGDLVIIPKQSFTRLFYLDDTQTPRDNDELVEAPFSDWHGLHWRAKLIFAAREEMRVGPIIHEMGHVFADAHPPHTVHCTEWNWLGWEICVAKLVGCYRQWDEQNAAYGTEPGDNWGELSRTQKQALAKERIADARVLGIIDRRNRPLAVR